MSEIKAIQLDVNQDRIAFMSFRGSSSDGQGGGRTIGFVAVVGLVVVAELLLDLIGDLIVDRLLLVRRQLAEAIFRQLCCSRY